MLLTYDYTRCGGATGTKRSSYYTSPTPELNTHGRRLGKELFEATVPQWCRKHHSKCETLYETEMGLYYIPCGGVAGTICSYYCAGTLILYAIDMTIPLCAVSQACTSVQGPLYSID